MQSLDTLELFYPYCLHSGGNEATMLQANQHLS